MDENGVSGTITTDTDRHSSVVAATKSCSDKNKVPSEEKGESQCHNRSCGRETENNFSVAAHSNAKGSQLSPVLEAELGEQGRKDGCDIDKLFNLSVDDSEDDKITKL